MRLAADTVDIIVVWMRVSGIGGMFVVSVLLIAILTVCLVPGILQVRAVRHTWPCLAVRHTWPCLAVPRSRLANGA